MASKFICLSLKSFQLCKLLPKIRRGCLRLINIIFIKFRVHSCLTWFICFIIYSSQRIIQLQNWLTSGIEISKVVLSSHDKHSCRLVSILFHNLPTYNIGKCSQKNIHTLNYLYLNIDFIQSVYLDYRFNLLALKECLASSFSIQYHPWIKH